MKDMVGPLSAQNASFVLLAEFDIDQGSILSHQYPYPTGMDEQLLAELMIPDGVHDHAEDWTIFFLNQTQGNSIASPLMEDEEHPETKGLLHVLNLVRTKHDKRVRRGAIVKALAICTHHPFIQIFKPVLLIALEDYYANPSVECLARLFDAVNAMDISLLPQLSRDEKLISRVSERKDVFIEKFVNPSPSDPRQALGKGHQKTPSSDSTSQFSLTNGLRKLSVGQQTQSHSGHGHERTASHSTNKQRSRSPSISMHSLSEDSRSHRSSTGAGSVIWVGENDTDTVPMSGKTQVASNFHFGSSEGSLRPERQRKTSMDQASISSSISQVRQEGTKTSSDGHHLSILHSLHRHRQPDTHLFDSYVTYGTHTLPIRIPVTIFPEEVGDYSLPQLIQTFTSPTAMVTGPIHPHLHTNGPLTHPLIILFNALITQKRIIFMGYGRPAGHVSNFVLAACAFGSGAGCHLRGFIERAFPFTNLANKAVMESVPGFIAGVTNPIYEQLPIWDVLCNIETGKITVHKDISAVPPPISSFPSPPSLSGRPGTTASNGDDDSRKAGDSHDALFIEELVTAISNHYGEAVLKARVAEYVQRFIRLAAAYEDQVIGSTSIGFPMNHFSETGVNTVTSGMGIPQGFGGSLGSGMVFADEASRTRELNCNANRIEGWRLTKSYEYWHQDFQNWLETRAIKGMDVQHQIGRLRIAKHMSDGEVDLIMQSLYLSVRSYDQVIELLSHLPPQSGGLLPITFGLFHPSQAIRDTTVDVMENIRAYSVGSQFCQNMNAFHRFALIHILDGRRQDHAARQQQQEQGSASQHQKAQIAQQLYNEHFNATSNRESRVPPLPPPKSKRETSLVSQMFSQSMGSSSGSSNGHGTSTTPSISRAGSVHRPGGTAF